MDWLVLAFMASLFWALGAVIDKYMLTEHVQDPFSYQLLYTIAQTPVLLLPLFVSVTFVFPWSVLGILGGFCTFFALTLYFRAVVTEEASRVISVLYISPIFVLPLAYLLLGEKLSLPAYFGVLAIVLGAILITHRKLKGTSFVMSTALWLVLASDVVWAGYEIMTKYVLEASEYTSYLFWNFIGTALIAISFFCFSRIRGKFLKDIKTAKRTAHLWRIVNTSLSFVALVFYYIAVSEGPVSLVSTSLSLEPFFVFLFTLPLSLYLPWILKEEMDRRIVVVKAIAILLILLGTWLITM